MSVTRTKTSQSFSTGGGVTTFTIGDFTFLDADELLVVRNTAGVSTTLVKDTDYTVSGGNNSTGSITTPSAISAGSTLIVTRVTKKTQLTSYTTGDRFPATTHERALDKLTMLVQEAAAGAIPLTAQTSGSAPYVLGLGATGGNPSWVSQTASAIADGSITPAKLSAGKPTWDTSGNLTATSFIGPVTGNVTGNLTGNVTGNLTGTASAVADGSVSLAKLVTEIQQALLPSGAVMAFAMNSAPTGWLSANGAAISRTVYSALFTAIGTLYGAGDGSTTFNIPDLRGYFVRGVGTNSDGTAAGTFGTKQADDFKRHSHVILGGTGTGTAGNGALSRAANGGADMSSNESPTTGGTETRPRNIAMLYCIKF
jgi:microcystin-dependent protein